jgi:hypothetical protein
MTWSLEPTVIAIPTMFDTAGGVLYPLERENIPRSMSRGMRMCLDVNKSWRILRCAKTNTKTH